MDANVQVRIDAEKNTGDIDVTASQLDNLGSAATALLGPLAAIGTAAGLVAFFKDAAAAAEENVQAIAHLQAQLQAAGLDVGTATETVKTWAEALQQSSRFGAPELEAALSRVVARTGDLAESQKLVQLAMNISVATGRDFNSELDTLAMAAGGSSRGVMALQRELGQAAVGITDTTQLLNMLSERYKDNALTSNTLTDASAKTKNTFHDMAAIIGDSLHPALAGLQTVAQGLEKVFGTLWSFLSLGIKDTATEISSMLLQLVATAESTARILKDVATGNFKDIAAARAEYTAKQAQIIAAANEQEKEDAAQSNNELRALGVQKAADAKAIIDDIGNHKKTVNKGDIAQELVDVQAGVAAIKAGEAQKLAEKNQSSAERLAIVKNALDAELALLDAHHAAYRSKEAQFQAERSKLISEAALKNTQIEQKYVADRVAALEAWKAHHADVMANMQAAGLKMADSVAAGFSNSVARSIVEGKSLEKEMQNLSKQIAEQVIADLIRIGVQALMTKAIQTGANDATAISIHAQTAAVGALTTALGAATVAATALDGALVAAA